MGFFRAASTNVRLFPSNRNIVTSAKCTIMSLYSKSPPVQHSGKYTATAITGHHKRSVKLRINCNSSYYFNEILPTPG